VFGRGYGFVLRRTRLAEVQIQSVEPRRAPFGHVTLCRRFVLGNSRVFEDPGRLESRFLGRVGKGRVGQLRCTKFRQCVKFDLGYRRLKQLRGCELGLSCGIRHLIEGADPGRGLFNCLRLCLRVCF